MESQRSEMGTPPWIGALTIPDRQSRALARIQTPSTEARERIHGMAQPCRLLLCGFTPARSKILLWILAAALGVYTLGPLLAHLNSRTTAAGLDSPCAACECEHIVADCTGINQELRNELYSRKVALLEEQLQLQEKVATERQQRADSVILDSKKLTSQCQKEVEKCNNGMETSEEARARADADLAGAKKMVALWKRRALDLGWRMSSERDGMLFP